MRPTVVKDWLLDLHQPARRLVVSAPDGDLTNDQIRPVEAIVSVEQELDGQVTNIFRIPLALEDNDRARLDAGGVLVLSMFGAQLQPFSVQVVMEGDWRE